MTHYMPFIPAPARLWAVELVGLDPMRPLPKRIWAVQWTATPEEAVQRTAWQAQAEGDTTDQPHVWQVEPYEASDQERSAHEWTPRPGTYYEVTP